MFWENPYFLASSIYLNVFTRLVERRSSLDAALLFPLLISGMTRIHKGDKKEDEPPNNPPWKTWQLRGLLGLINIFNGRKHDSLADDQNPVGVNAQCRTGNQRGNLFVRLHPNTLILLGLNTFFLVDAEG